MSYNVIHASTVSLKTIHVLTIYLYSLVCTYAYVRTSLLEKVIILVIDGRTETVFQTKSFEIREKGWCDLD